VFFLFSFPTSLYFLSSLYFIIVGVEITCVESLQFDLGTIEGATNNFSNDNKIGKGRFGTIYKVEYS
jgi:hypothetical protein